MISMQWLVSYLDNNNNNAGFPPRAKEIRINRLTRDIALLENSHNQLRRKAEKNVCVLVVIQPETILPILVT